jgi:hypothetical protein
VPDRSSVLAMFDRKYGPRQFDGPGRPRLALRLIPRDDAGSRDDPVPSADPTG